MENWSFRLVNKVFIKNIVSLNFLSGSNTLYITLRNAEDILSFSLFLRNQTNCQFDQLLDLWVVDNLLLSQRFIIYYKFTSLKFNETVICRFSINKDQEVPSLIYFYFSANWLEREAWDMFGIFFANHFDLRRILTDYGFWGFPLRKDFPLVGYLEIKYNLDLEKIIFEPVELLQEYRFFDFLSPWQVNNNF